jgi:hypothetical protein
MKRLHLRDRAGHLQPEKAPLSAIGRYSEALLFDWEERFCHKSFLLACC